MLDHFPIERMLQLTHEATKSFSRAKMDRKSLNGINSEFLDLRKKIRTISTLMVTSYNFITSTREFWAAVARHQRDFVETLAIGFRTQGAVLDHILQVEKSTRHIRINLNDDDDNEVSHKRMSKMVFEYIELMHDIEDECETIEMAYLNKVHYEQKMNKLEGKPFQKAEVLQRNLEKLTQARDQYDARLSAILADMRSVLARHEFMLQCAHHAFWMANQTYSSIIQDITSPIRLESIAIYQRFLTTNEWSENCFAPIPRLPEIAAFGLSSAELQQRMIESRNIEGASSMQQKSLENIDDEAASSSK